MTRFTPRLTADELFTFMVERFPEVFQSEEAPWVIDAVGPGRLDMRLKYRARFLRPGGTISGPTMMTLVDTAMYLLVLSHVGPVELAVTTSLHIDFLRRPAPTDLIATAELLKLGKKLAVGRVLLRSAGDDAPIAHASVTYALPPSQSEEINLPR